MECNKTLKLGERGYETFVGPVICLTNMLHFDVVALIGYYFEAELGIKGKR